MLAFANMAKGLGFVEMIELTGRKMTPGLKMED